VTLLDVTCMFHVSTYIGFEYGSV